MRKSKKNSRISNSSKKDVKNSNSKRTKNLDEYSSNDATDCR